jgi:hypothetical protein
MTLHLHQHHDSCLAPHHTSCHFHSMGPHHRRLLSWVQLHQPRHPTGRTRSSPLGCWDTPCDCEIPKWPSRVKLLTRSADLCSVRPWRPSAVWLPVGNCIASCHRRPFHEECSSLAAVAGMLAASSHISRSPKAHAGDIQLLVPASVVAVDLVPHHLLDHSHYCCSDPPIPGKCQLFLV